MALPDWVKDNLNKAKGNPIFPLKPLKRVGQYKTVFTIVIYNYGESATEAEDKSIKQFEDLVGKQKAQEIMKTNYPLTSIIEVN